MGPLTVLVHRLLGAKPYVKCEGAELLRLHDETKGMAWKAETAIGNAHTLGYHGTVIVVDRDKPKFAVRLSDLEQGRERAERKGLPWNTALGLAIEEMEAWLLPDHIPDPESVTQPKETLNASPEQMTARAGQLDLDLLTRRCPKGFAPFRREVEERLRPLVGNA